MATFLVRAYELITGSEMSVARDWFPDDERHTAHETAINKAATAGLSGGRAAGSYGPGLSVTRAQMASFLARTLTPLVEEGRADPPACTSTEERHVGKMSVSPCSDRGSAY